MNTYGAHAPALSIIYLILSGLPKAEINGHAKYKAIPSATITIKAAMMKNVFDLLYGDV